VCAHVFNFTSYFYVEIDTRVANLVPSDLDQIKSDLNRWTNSTDNPCVVHIELVEKASVMFY
jgi:hypothetical protein